MEKIYDVAVVGSGVAAYSAALSLKSRKADYLWLGTKGFGEKVRLSEYVRNYPAFTGDGKAFSAALARQAEEEGVVLTEGRADGVYAMGEQFLITANGKEYYARAVILATGVETAGNLKGEREFLGRGVSYCAVCDGALYRGKEIAVVISSRDYEEEVEYLAGFASAVHVFSVYKDPLFHAKNIVLHKGLPLAIEGNLRVEKLILREGELPVSGIFFLKNAAPPSALVGGLETEGAHVVVRRDLSTNLEGLFAAGDVTGRPYQFVKAAGEGCVAADSAIAYLRTAKKEG